MPDVATSQTRPSTLPLIGWREWVALPELGIDRIKAKIDTGARSSALHAVDVRPMTVEGAPWISFRLHPVQRQTATTVLARAPVIDERTVRSSTGRETHRPVIETAVTLGERSWMIELTLVRRDLMGFRMLLGRQAIRSRFVVDAGRSYLGGEPRAADRRLSRDGT